MTPSFDENMSVDLKDKLSYLKNKFNMVSSENQKRALTDVRNSSLITDLETRN